MDIGSIAARAALADAFYNQALSYDRAGNEEMTTAHLEISMLIMLGLAAEPSARLIDTP